MFKSTPPPKITVDQQLASMLLSACICQTFLKKSNNPQITAWGVGTVRPRLPGSATHTPLCLPGFLGQEWGTEGLDVTHLRTHTHYSPTGRMR